MTEERLRQGLRLLSTVVQAFAQGTGDYQGLLAAIAKSVAEAIPDTCIVTLRSDDDTVTPVAFHDRDPARIAIFQATLQQRQPLREARLSADAMIGGALFMPYLDLEALRARLSVEGFERLRASGARGMLVVPMQTGGETYGVLTVLRYRPELPPLDEFDFEIVKDLAHHAALAICNARMFARLEHSEQVRLAEERAVQASALLDAIIENIPDMVFVKDADRLAFVRFNRAGEDLLGMSRDALIGKTDFDFFPASEAEFFVAKDRETLAKKALVEILEEPIQTRSGTRWLHTKKVPLLDAAGTPRYLLGISQDITERKTALAELRGAKDAAEAANRELEAFSYSVAHDLRTPLRAIDGFSQALLEDYAAKLDDEGRRLLGRVRDSTHRMATLIDDLLTLSRVTRAELHRERVDLSALAYTVLGGLQRIDPARALEIVIQPNLAVEADPSLIAVVFDNLFGNAWKFTAKREQTRIELGSELVDGVRVYSVRDNGAGFDMTYAHKLFGVFQRLHRDTEFPGTGIGLATVARIIRRHHGRIWAQSAVGEGATFYFTLAETHE